MLPILLTPRIFFSASENLIEVSLDTYARDVFDLWYQGHARAVEIFENDKWSRYMMKNEYLYTQIYRQLLKKGREFITINAKNKKFTHNGSFRVYCEPYSTIFHADAAAGSGGYFTGYDVLNGSNIDAGGLQILGYISIIQPNINNDKLIVKFTNNKMIFNDVVDHNKKYGFDSFMNIYLKMQARQLFKTTPKDYTLRIKWTDPGPLVIPMLL